MSSRLIFGIIGILGSSALIFQNCNHFAVNSPLVPLDSKSVNSTPLIGSQGSPAISIKSIQLTLLSNGAPPGATDNSHMQHILRNSKGIFVVHLDASHPTVFSGISFTYYRWSLKHSLDGGRSFTELLASENAGPDPAIETDDENNIYVIQIDHSPVGYFSDSHGLTVTKLYASSDYRSRSSWKNDLSQPGKFSTVYDPTRSQFYVLPFGTGPFISFGKEGGVKGSQQMFITEPNNGVVVEYPHLRMDGGRLYASWTTARADGFYYSIHYIWSDDGGSSWNSPSGRLSLPITASDSRTVQVVPQDVLGIHSTWLSNFYVRAGEIFFMFYALSPGLEGYRIYSAESGVQHVSNWNSLKGAGLSIRSLSGFFTDIPALSRQTIYAIGRDLDRRDANSLFLVVSVASDDSGRTWRDIATTETRFNPTGISGPRSISNGEELIGLFTHDRGLPGDNNQVYFFKVDGR